MQFLSPEFVQAVQEKLNAKSAFNTASKWSDTKVLVGFGDKRYWMKLYRGKVIDVMEYLPMANPLGWNFSISGSMEAWEDLRKGRKALGELVNFGHIAVEGNMLEAETLATVPKISITIRKAYGMGWNVMLSPGEGADFIVAWPIASISFVDPLIGIELVHSSKITKCKDPRAEREKLQQVWATESAPWKAAEQHYCDDIIDPRDTRRFIAAALDIARGRRGSIISKYKLQTWPTGF